MSTTPQNEYLVQVGKNKGAYVTRWSFTNYNRAAIYYSGLNVHSGYKKRLVSPEGKILNRTLT